MILSGHHYITIKSKIKQIIAIKCNVKNNFEKKEKKKKKLLFKQ
jgi:hypothetical protein